MVGYSTKTVNKYKIIVNQFRDVNGTEVNMTLGDISTNSTGEEGEYTEGWDWESDLLITWGVVNGKGKSTGTYKYLPKFISECPGHDFEGKEVGWYDTNDDGYEECLNSTKLPYGEGAVIKSSGSGAALLFNGEVKNGITDIPVNKYKICGNGTPVQITLSDVSTNSAGEEGEYTEGWDWESDLLITWGVVSGKGKSTGTYKYLPKFISECPGHDFEGKEVGWYDTNDDGYEECLNSTTIPAGEGFVIKSSGSGAAITMTKNPLAK